MSTLAEKMLRWRELSLELSLLEKDIEAIMAYAEETQKEEERRRGRTGLPRTVNAYWVQVQERKD